MLIADWRRIRRFSRWPKRSPRGILHFHRLSGHHVTSHLVRVYYHILAPSGSPKSSWQLLCSRGQTRTLSHSTAPGFGVWSLSDRTNVQLGVLKVIHCFTIENQSGDSPLLSFITNKINPIILYRYSIQSVSYTHLDVYKRQVYSSTHIVHKSQCRIIN